MIFCRQCLEIDSTGFVAALQSLDNAEAVMTIFPLLRRRGRVLLPLAINHVSAPNLNWRELLDLASALNCEGVEFRNDLNRPLFSGESADAVASEAAGRGQRIVGLSEVYGFNCWSEKIRREVQALAATAKKCGAESINLIPSNDGSHPGKIGRQSMLRNALREIRGLLEEAGILGFVEPLGFLTSSLRSKAEAVDAIESVNGSDQFRIVHDTFHHFLAGEDEIFADRTGVIHVSGVADPSLSPHEMEDRHRLLVDGHDRIGNIDQIAALREAGYSGPVSMEAFSPVVQSLNNPKAAIGRSFEFIRMSLAAHAA